MATPANKTSAEQAPEAPFKWILEGGYFIEDDGEHLVLHGPSIADGIFFDKSDHKMAEFLGFQMAAARKSLSSEITSVVRSLSGTHVDLETVLDELEMNGSCDKEDLAMNIRFVRSAADSLQEIVGDIEGTDSNPSEAEIV